MLSESLKASASLIHQRSRDWWLLWRRSKLLLSITVSTSLQTELSDILVSPNILNPQHGSHLSLTFGVETDGWSECGLTKTVLTNLKSLNILNILKINKCPVFQTTRAYESLVSPTHFTSFQNIIDLIWNGHILFACINFNATQRNSF